MNGPSDQRVRSDLFWLFAVIYVVEACCEPRGLIGQPLMRYAKETLGWSPVQISALFSLFALPWLLKPVFGLVSDLVPLFGYHRRSYLIAANGVALASYLIIAATAASAMPVYPLMGVFVAMAVSSTVVGGLLVESGQRTGESDLLVNQQWLWLYLASVPVSAIGGWLAAVAEPGTGMRVASAILSLGPLVVISAAVLVVRESRSPVTRTDRLRAGVGLLRSFLDRRLMIAAAFLFFYMFSPGFYVALYYHMTDRLQFDQQFIGVLGSIGAAGSVAGALMHRIWLRHLPLRKMIYGVLAAGAGSALSYLLLRDPVSAIVINFVGGITGGLTIIVAATLAADYCPRGAEASGYAILATVENLAIRLSDISGSYLYENMFSRQLAPLVLISAAATIFPMFLTPLLRLGAARQGEPLI